MIDGINYYQILGVPEDALLKEIQSAWRKFVKENHEDLVAPEERQAAMERMFRINEAYEVLSDENKKRIYDQYGEEGLQGAGMGGQGFGGGGF
ncbi:MAG: DnaJ domain-containing protein, partial [Nitrospirales bacterium]|nr:DnaJ domain-containing protein [Nitrospirales bacterium]